MGRIWDRIRYGRPVELVEPELPKVPAPPPRPGFRAVDVTPFPAAPISERLRELLQTTTTTAYVGKMGYHTRGLSAPRKAAESLGGALGAVGEVASTVDFQTFGDALGEIAGAAIDIASDATDS